MTNTEETFRTVTEYGEFEDTLRSIRLFIDGCGAVFHLIPSVISSNPIDPAEIDNPQLFEVLKDSSEIVESTTCLRLEFESIYAIAVDCDAGFDPFGGLQNNWSEAPLLAPKKSFYPCLEIMHSSWKEQIPEWLIQGEDNIKHFRFISLDYSFDVLGVISSANWIENPDSIQTL